jgi:hypothetical protein
MRYITVFKCFSTAKVILDLMTKRRKVQTGFELGSCDFHDMRIWISYRVRCELQADIRQLRAAGCTRLMLSTFAGRARPALSCAG